MHRLFSSLVRKTERTFPLEDLAMLYIKGSAYFKLSPVDHEYTLFSPWKYSHLIWLSRYCVLPEFCDQVHIEGDKHPPIVFVSQAEV